MREERGRLLAILVGKLTDIELAEDALQDAVESALFHWAKNGLPKNPEAWLLKTAKHKAIDKIRRAKNFAQKQDEYRSLLDLEIGDIILSEDQYAVPDERLRLMFTCCHPVLEGKVSVALTLQLLGGLSVPEIARAFLVKPETMAQRLVRGKRKIREAQTPYNLPKLIDFPQRLNMVLTVLYLIFNEGYSASSGAHHIRENLCFEAVRLARILLKLCPEDPEVMALLALMLLHDARRPARYSSQGEYIPLEEQDRNLWLQAQVTEGAGLVQRALKKAKIGPTQLQAAISAVHSEAPDFQHTPWDEILLLYDELYKIQPTPVIKLNRAVALSYACSPKEAIDDLKTLEEHFTTYQPFFAVKADFLRRNGDMKGAKNYYLRAIKLSGNEAEKSFLKNRMESLTI